ncbi:signal peptidase II [Micromonospora sp. STR1s_5]|nr:signal peptidase II [Micromonospora sp. STR1s_5]
MFRAVVLIAAVVLAADQLTKYWAESTLSGGQTITVVGDLLQLRLVYNPGAAFSIGARTPGSSRCSRRRRWSR